MKESEVQYVVEELIRKFDHVRSPSKRSWTLKELLDFLRVRIVYNVFDLEATRRENAYLKKLLGGKK